MSHYNSFPLVNNRVAIKTGNQIILQNMDNTPRASIHVGDPAKSFSAAEGTEPERRGWDKDMYQRKNQDPNNHYDFTRKKLNFELDSTRKPLELGSNPIPLHERVKNRLDELGFSPYYEKDSPDVIADNSPNCTVTIIISGNHDVLHKLAYDNQDVDLTLQRSNAHIKRKAGIENWAKDTFDFVCRRFGEENVIGFDVHLDETTPHAQIQIIPVAKAKTRGRKTFLYVKNDDPKVVLSSKKWKKLSEEERQKYTQTEKAKDEKECVSYAKVFGENKYEVSKTYIQMHTDYYNEVGHKYGLERGTCIKDLPFEEQLDHIHKNKNILEAERVAKEKLEESQSIISALDDKKAELEQQTKDAELRKELAEQDANLKELYKNLASVSEQELKIPQLDIDGIIKAAQTIIDKELGLPIPQMGQKRWHEERMKNIRQALTDMQTNLGISKNNHNTHVTTLCKNIRKHYKDELAQLIDKNKKLAEENKELKTQVHNLNLTNQSLRLKISSLDENAVTQLRNEKSTLTKERNEANQRADIAEYNYNDLHTRWDIIWSYPEMVSAWDAIVESEKRLKLAQEEKARREAQAKENAKTTLLDKCILVARNEIQMFGKSGKNEYDDANQINIVLCGILAMASKLNINPAVEVNCTRTINDLLNGIKWVNYRPMQKNMAEWRTPQMVDEIGGITQGMVSTFNEYLGGVHPVMSSGGSNGAADTLTNWDGSEVTNGWRAPARPNFLNYTKKGGKSVAY